VGQITENVRRILRELPGGVTLVAAAKGRSAAEISETIEAGISIVGENYIQETERVRRLVGRPAQWHCIGHLQRNKVKKAVALFDLIQTVDSVPLAEEIDRLAQQAGRVMPVLIEVNSGREAAKTGVFPEQVIPLIGQIASLPGIRVCGLMTMGPLLGLPLRPPLRPPLPAADLRPYFALTKSLFDRLKREAPAGVEMKYLSMGMSDSYQVAIEEGANMVRLGRVLFGSSA
jgi:hypothetical protein